ncbi:hypothetical protein HanHA300_Chr10g0345461 [Helianthus annuus]|nr:hypothetical protein HanHA300_Chr10g0345461 [Helianthus annuus]KAJ0528470.1 hypothetical protein HanHA89_Chr10g0366771 [Helianthus annuus]KAJ0695410.1 hypothetical protein HanLR1_Chr10g0345241 [Helianthus annuus]
MKMLRSPAPVREDDWCFRLSCQFVVYVVNKRQFDLRSEAVQASAHWRFGCRKVMSTSEWEIKDQMMSETGTERPYSVGSSSTIQFECYKSWFSHVGRTVGDHSSMIKFAFI